MRIQGAPSTAPSPIFELAADGLTAIPGGTGNFIAFPSASSLSDGLVAFVGNGAGGQQGLYTRAVGAPPQEPPLRIVDTATAIPAGSGNFIAFPSAPSLSGRRVAFVGSGSGRQQGVYARALAGLSNRVLLAPPQETLLVIADTSTTIPGGSGNFIAFPGAPSLHGERVAFVGSGSNGQQGLYTRALTALPQGPPLRIADTATAIPGGSGNFTGIGDVAFNEAGLVFLGTGSGGQAGIYNMRGGQLLKVIALGESIQSKTITGLNFSRDGLDAGGAVAFQATFRDGSQGVYALDVVPQPSELRITDVSFFGNELRLSFPSSSGRSYAIESRADLSAGQWSEVPGTTTISNGAAIELTVPIALAQPQQFYRVKQLP